MSKYLSNEALKLQNQVRQHMLLTSTNIQEIPFDPIDFRVLYLLITQCNLDISSCKSLPKANIASASKLKGFDTSVMEISIESRCHG